MLIDVWEWRAALWWLAVVVGPGFALLCLLLIRDKPESCGLLADNQAPPLDRHEEQVVQRNFTLKEVRRNVVFWLYSMGLSIHALFGTAVIFHIVAIFAEAGRSREEAFAYFIPQALVSVATNLGASALADYTRLKPFLLLMLASFTIGAVGLVFLQHEFGYWSLVVGFGVAGPVGDARQFDVYSPLRAKAFGRNKWFERVAHSVREFHRAIAVQSRHDPTGTFAAGPVLCIFGLVALFTVSAGVKQPLDVAPNR